MVPLVVAPTVVAHADRPKDPFEAMAAVRATVPTSAPDLTFRSLDGRVVRLRLHFS
jgi:hypothetical protein